MSATGATAAARPRQTARAIRAALVPSPRTARRLVALGTAACVLVAGYLFWLRDSALVQVEKVTVTGLGGADADRVRAALASTAKGMTTLHVSRGRLERAAAAFPVVRAIDVAPDFPNGMRIHVVQHRPAAWLVSGSRRLPVAGDGTVLTGLAVSGSLPLVKVTGALPAKQVPAGAALQALRVAGGIPAALRTRVREIRRERGKGMVVPLAGGPRLIFGDAGRVTAKWAAAIRVLADPDAAGAAYVDVRIPERPAAGGLPVKTVTPVAPAEAPAPQAPPPPESAPAASAPAPTPAVTAPGSPADSGAPAAPEGASHPSPPPTQTPAAEGGGTTANPQP